MDGTEKPSVAVSYPDIMVDIETTGTHPHETAMIQLAAVRFNFVERTIDTASFFDKCLMIPENRYWNEDTRKWWSGQDPTILQGIMSRMTDPKEVMQDFADWVRESKERDYRMWAKPVTFDSAFVTSYFNQYQVMSPFHYGWVTDLNSFIRGMAHDPGVRDFKVKFTGPAHNALFDCINQIDSLFQAADHYSR